MIWSNHKRISGSLLPDILRMFVSTEAHEYGTDKNKEIGDIKDDIAKLFPLYIETEIIYHVSANNAIIGIAECTAKNKSQTCFTSDRAFFVASAKASAECRNCNEDRHADRHFFDNPCMLIQCVQCDAFIMMFPNDDDIFQNVVLLLHLSVSFNMVFDTEIDD